MRIYVAGPYSPDPEGNTEKALAAAELLRRQGHTPFVPHAHYSRWCSSYPLDWDTVMDLCLEEVRRSDVLVRLPGVSPGADAEVAEAKRHRIPVWTMEAPDLNPKK